MTKTVIAIVEEVIPYTMMPRERLIENLEFLHSLISDGRIPCGSVVECGVWKGGMALALMRLLGPDRAYAFFDSFEGLPPPSERDEQDALYWAAHPEHPRYFDNCRADYAEARNMLLSQAADGQRVEIVKGWFESTLKLDRIAPVALAHLDADWYDATSLCLDRIWPTMVPGGILLIDDYYDWEGCRKAVHDFLARNNARESIRSVGKFGGVAITRMGPWTLAQSPHLI